MTDVLGKVSYCNANFPTITWESIGDGYVRVEGPGWAHDCRKLEVIDCSVEKDVAELHQLADHAVE